MCKQWVDQHLKVLDLCSISINKILVTEFMTVIKFTESKLNAQNVNAVKSTT